MKRVNRNQVEISKPTKLFLQINLHPEKFPFYQIHFVSVTVNQEPGTILLVYFQTRFSHKSYPFLLLVNQEDNINFSLTNVYKRDKTILRSFEKAESADKCHQRNSQPSPPFKTIKLKVRVHEFRD